MAPVEVHRVVSLVAVKLSSEKSTSSTSCSASFWHFMGIWFCLAVNINSFWSLRYSMKLIKLLLITFVRKLEIRLKWLSGLTDRRATSTGYISLTKCLLDKLWTQLDVKSTMYAPVHLFLRLSSSLKSDRYRTKKIGWFLKIDPPWNDEWYRGLPSKTTRFFPACSDHFFVTERARTKIARP